MAQATPQEMIQTVELVYAQSLLELAQDAGVLDDVAAQMVQIAELSEREPGLIRLISTRTISVDQRAKIIEHMLKGKVHDLLYRFLQVVNRKNRLEHLQGIAAALAHLVDEANGIVRVDAYVTSLLDEAHAEQLAERIGGIIDGKVVLRQEVQPDLIGGVKMRIGDRLIDGSVAAQLRALERRIGETGRASARDQAKTLIGD